MNHVFIALCTNIEPRLSHLKDALKKIEANVSINIKKTSSIYETAPVGYLEQADFLNMVLEIETSLMAIQLLDVCQEIEHQLGRERGIRFGPRTIDLDILTYNEENIKTERLLIPHPRMHERAFVLVPLAEIAPKLTIQGLNKNVETLLNEQLEKDLKDVKNVTIANPGDKKRLLGNKKRKQKKSNQKIKITIRKNKEE